MIHIVCNIDSNYVEHCGVMLSSLLLHNPGEAFQVHILHMGLTPEDKTRLSGLTRKHPVTFSFYDIPTALLAGFPIKQSDHLSLASYLRIFMPELLPADIDKVLYLDCDLIVTDSVAGLWETDVTGVAVAGVEERPPFDIEAPDRLGYPRQNSYFNAGVMLINLKRWREMDFTTLGKQYIIENSGKIVHHDQDVINALLNDRKQLISIRWNLMDFFLLTKPDIQKRRTDDLNRAVKHPAIIHFTGSRKPWLHNCDSPFRKLYLKTAAEGGWQVISPKEKIHYCFRNNLYELLFFLKLKKRKTLKRV